MNKIAHSLKWVFSTIILRRILTFLLFWYVINNFTRAEYGVYRQFLSINVLFSLLAIFSFNLIAIVEQTKNHFKLGMQFILISSVIGSLIMLSIHNFLAVKYGSEDISKYILFGFWLVIPETMKRLVNSIHQLDMNFKLRSIAETANVFVFVGLTIILFWFDKKFEYYVIAFYIGSLVELIIICFPLRKEIIKDLMNCLLLKYLKPLKDLMKEKFTFLCVTTTPTVLNIFLADAPLLLFGFFYTKVEIGNYSAIAQLIIMPVSLLTLALSQVYFPAFGKTSKEFLPQSVITYIKHVVVILWFPVIIFGLLLKYWSYLLLGSQDIEIITAILIWLVSRTLFSLLLHPLITIPIILKKPQYELYWTIYSLALICISIYLFKNYNFVTMVAIYTIITIITSLIFIFTIFKILNMRKSNLIKLLLKGLCYNTPLLLLLFFYESSYNLSIILLIILCTLLSAGLLYFFEKKFLLSAIKKVIK